MKIIFRKNYLKKSLGFIVFSIFTLCIIIYVPCEIYTFQPQQKFSGDYLYNPYAATNAAWQKSNFHAHAIAWNGVTNGKQPAKQILDLYKQKGYAYSCISNYESVAKEDENPNAVNVYEHGYNIHKVHQLVIMPHQVCYNDFPLWQFTSTKQFVLNKLSASAKAVVIAHPKVKHGYSDEDLKKLSGYNLMEVLNHAGNASDKWDVALSAGKPVWVIGDDDTHDALDSNQTFNNWTMINCNKHNKDSLVNNLINGNAYAVNGKNACTDNQLISSMTNGMHISLKLKNKADSILLIGQNGIKRKIFFNTNKADYTFLKNDTYIREVIYNKATTMYLNPVLRFDGKANPQNILTARVDSAATIFYRSFLLMCWLIAFIYFNPRIAMQILKLLKRGFPTGRKNPQFGLDI